MIKIKEKIMNYFKTILLVLLFTSLLYAQDEKTAEVDSANISPWTPRGTGALNLTQIALSNWTGGGDNALAWTLIFDFGLDYNKDNWTLKNSLKAAYGRTKLGNEDYRTNDNEFFLENVLSYNVGWPVSPYLSNTVRSTISKGFDYKADPIIQTADFFDPGYIQQGIGFTYHHEKIIITRLGLSFKETIASDYKAQYTDDPDTPDEIEGFKFETGIESVTETEYALQENLLLKSKLNLFTRFNALDVWDVRWDNSIVAKINEYLNVNLNVVVVYEKAQSLKTQLKQALQIGLTYNFF